MRFASILFESPYDGGAIDQLAEPGFFGDLNLDQIIESVMRGRDDYNLKPYFYAPLKDEQAVRYRHEVMRDLERPEIFALIRKFAAQMSAMRTELGTAEKLRYHWQKSRWFLDAVQTYCNAVACFAEELGNASAKSAGLQALHRYVAAYCNAEYFQTLRDEQTRIRAELATVRYNILIKGNSVTVQRYANEPDYSEEVQQTFEKFKQGAVKRYGTEMADTPDMNHVESQVLGFVARLHPEVFNPFEEYCNRNAGFVDPVVAQFDREVQFYVAYLEYIAKLKEGGLSFCYPSVSRQSKDVRSVEGFDLALAEKLNHDKIRIVCNDFRLEGEERIIVVTGPNQGGKTTFSRTFGQLHYLACMGWPVPGREAKLFLFDQIFTHFERQEDMKNLRGKLHDDLVRIHDILSRATTNSIVIMNEIFSSTSLKDALFLSKRVMQRIMELGALSVYVTFIEELSSLSAQTVSMLSEVQHEQHDMLASRTYKVKRRPADGRSYAVSLAQQYGLTYDQLKERLES